MKKKIDYKEQLKSPKWQKRRLEIYQRDNFTCQICGATDKQLHVHHLEYIHGNDIWDYDDSLLITLCDNCHNKEHDLFNEVDGLNILLHDIRMSGFTNVEIKYLLEELLVNDFLLRLILFKYTKKDDDYSRGKADLLNRLIERRKTTKPHKTVL